MATFKTLEKGCPKDVHSYVAPEQNVYVYIMYLNTSQLTKEV